jgi:hypothetical protein
MQWPGFVCLEPRSGLLGDESAAMHRQMQFRNANRAVWTIDQQTVGFARSALNLTYVDVANAGHMVREASAA